MRKPSSRHDLRKPSSRHGKSRRARKVANRMKSHELMRFRAINEIAMRFRAINEIASDIYIRNE